MPKDPVILLGYVNQQLRDTYPSLKEFCKSNNIAEESLQKKLRLIDYHYDKQTNQFV
ncbi:MAG: DUF4250 domain-containing protein [Lachnospiraceae bacterium]|jgi:hypothetical protein|nr:DUF4250 domain-containing protein [Lachnospiraceae bacterium]